jgi:hypothetical protein
MKALPLVAAVLVSVIMLSPFVAQVAFAAPPTRSSYVTVSISYKGKTITTSTTIKFTVKAYISPTDTAYGGTGVGEIELIVDNSVVATVAGNGSPHDSCAFPGIGPYPSGTHTYMAKVGINNPTYYDSIYSDTYSFTVT